MVDPTQDRMLSIKQRYVVGGGTEPPFSGYFTNGVKYNTKRPGTFHCAVCDLPAYASSSKFKSGTGWPSFYEVCRRATRCIGARFGGPRSLLQISNKQLLFDMVHVCCGCLQPVRRGFN